MSVSSKRTVMLAATFRMAMTFGNQIKVRVGEIYGCCAVNDLAVRGSGRFRNEAWGLWELVGDRWSA